jgi:hypothetical protein
MASPRLVSSGTQEAESDSGTLSVCSQWVLITSLRSDSRLEGNSSVPGLGLLLGKDM